jgi:hypothetical protein
MAVTIEGEASMTKLQLLEDEIKKLSPEEIAQLRDWLLEFDADQVGPRSSLCRIISQVRAASFEAFCESRFLATLRSAPQSRSTTGPVQLRVVENESSSSLSAFQERRRLLVSAGRAGISRSWS